MSQILYRIIFIYTVLSFIRMFIEIKSFLLCLRAESKIIFVMSFIQNKLRLIV